jgi:hypothetical protein
LVAIIHIIVLILVAAHSALAVSDSKTNHTASSTNNIAKKNDISK